ncbi:MAG: hypothetical protein M1823_001734 [Watsoniomyces obsoletus]|nr:MAG: hypothetical protein M1823_001734 [Watsoniomyces obsoletus]
MSSSALSPRDIYELSRRQDKDANGQPFIRGSGTISPGAFNNKAIFVLFGFLGVGLVITSIWFFFWAKNGGFKFQKGDWEDYKSTVLRRKGKDGKTLSNATPRTNLGFGNSIRGADDDDEHQPDEEMAEVRLNGGGDHIRNARDDDVRRYRHEKPARVGGLNRKADGSYYDTSTNSEMSSEYSPVKPSPPVIETEMETKKTQKKKTKTGGGFWGGVRAVSGEKKKPKENNKRQTSAAYSFVEGDDSTVSGGGGDATHLNEQRQQRQYQHHRQQRASQYDYRRQASQSPRKSYHQDHHTVVSGDTAASSYGEEGSVVSGETGTKSYPHHIPGLITGGGGGRAESPSYRDHTSSPRRAARKGGRAGAGSGGGGRRRDSLSDSD